MLPLPFQNRDRFRYSGASLHIPEPCSKDPITSSKKDSDPDHCDSPVHITNILAGNGHIERHTVIKLASKENILYNVVPNP